MNGVRFGAASVDVTPGPGVDLFRFGPEPRTSDTVLDDLRATALCLEDGGGDLAVLCSVDLIWLPRALCEAVRGELAASLGLAPERVFLCATHTHGSPQLLETGGGARPHAAYADGLVRALVECAERAHAALEPGELRLARARCPVAVYRRKAIPDPSALKRLRWRRMLANRPVPDHAVDDVLTAVWLHDAQDRPRAALLNLACHPSLFRGNAVSADYPGRVRRMLAERHGPGFETLFLQGFAGNLRPDVVRRAPLRLSRPVESLYALLFDRLRFAKDAGPDDLDDLARRVVGCLDSTAPGAVACDGVAAWSGEAALPLEGGAGEVRLGVHALSLGPGLALVGLEGEIFMEYALWLRGLDSGALPVSCCGGMVGYVPDEASLAQGGYEVDRSLGVFGLPARFAPGVERRVKNGILEALRALGRTAMAGDGDDR